jgi:LysM repeat protein
VTVAELATANGITNPEFILVGTVLKIPGCGSSTPPKPTATPTRGATSTAGAIQPRPGDTVDKNGDILHTVVSGENLYRIALAYGLSWQVVATYNGITSPNAIVVGQVIRIPTK